MMIFLNHFLIWLSLRKFQKNDISKYKNLMILYNKIKNNPNRLEIYRLIPEMVGKKSFEGSGAPALRSRRPGGLDAIRRKARNWYADP